MATPSPISATRNSTMNDMSMTYVNGNNKMNVVRIEAAATTIGSNARNDANTNASTASAPTAPRRTSANTPGPPDESSPTARASSPVTPVAAPDGAAFANAALMRSVGYGAVGSCWNR